MLNQVWISAISSGLLGQINSEASAPTSQPSTPGPGRSPGQVAQGFQQIGGIALTQAARNEAALKAIPRVHSQLAFINDVTNEHWKGIVHDIRLVVSCQILTFCAATPLLLGKKPESSNRAMHCLRHNGSETIALFLEWLQFQFIYICQLDDWACDTDSSLFHLDAR